MTLAVISSKITPQTKAWRAFVMVAKPSEKSVVMDLAARLYADADLEEGPILFSLTSMTFKDFARKYNLPRDNEKAEAIVNITMRSVGLSFMPQTAKVA